MFARTAIPDHVAPARPPTRGISEIRGPPVAKSSGAPLADPARYREHVHAAAHMPGQKSLSNFRCLAAP